MIYTLRHLLVVCYAVNASPNSFTLTHAPGDLTLCKSFTLSTASRIRIAFCLEKSLSVCWINRFQQASCKCTLTLNFDLYRLLPELVK